METLFNKKFEQLLKEYGGPLDLQVNTKHGGNYTGSTDDDETAYDDEAEESKLGKETDRLQWFPKIDIDKNELLQEIKLVGPIMWVLAGVGIGMMLLIKKSGR